MKAKPDADEAKLDQKIVELNKQEEAFLQTVKTLFETDPDAAKKMLEEHLKESQSVFDQSEKEYTNIMKR